MPLVSGTYPTFLGGTSQQDDTVRSPSQLSEAVNAWMHAAMGAGKRPPAEFVGNLRADLNPDSHFHSIVRDDTERYIVVVGHRSVRVFDHEAAYEYTVNVTGAALDYLDTQGQRPWSVFSTCTYADTTFIVNRLVSVKLSDELSPGTLVGSVQTMSDLPSGKDAATVPTGAIYNVIGSDLSEFDDYYVQKQSEKVYLEVAKPGIKHRFDSKTMPLILKRIPDPIHADGFWFSLGAPEWTARLSGDQDSNPPPSLDGQRIRDVFLHRERLGFLSTENVLLSEVTDPYNLWRTSVTQVLDSDPIDTAVVTNGVTTLYHAVPFKSSLFLAAAGGQHMLTAEPYMASKYVKSDPVNSYSSSPWVKPKLMGESLYSVDDEGKYATIREYFMDDTEVTGDAADVTAHVPRYIPGRIRALATGDQADAVFVALDNPRESQVYAYFVRWAGDEKQQSSWTRWTISGVGRVVHMHCIADTLYVVAASPAGGCELLRFNLALNQEDADVTADYTYLMDRMTVVQPAYQAFGNQTWIDLPFIVDEGMTVTVLKTDDWEDPGAYLELPAGTSWTNGGTRLVLPGNHAQGRVVVGMDYEHRLTLTRPLMRSDDKQAVLIGRLQVRDIEVAYKDAAYFEVEVESKGTGRRETFLAAHSGAYTARVLNDSAFRTSSPTFHSGSRRFPVLSNAEACRIHLVNRLPFQCWFQSAQWRGMFVTRSRL